MMECDEIVEYINASEFAFDVVKPCKGRKASVLTVAAMTFASMWHERDDQDIMAEFAELIRMVSFVQELRKGNDPRCSLCKATGKLKRPERRAIHEVLQ